MAEVTEDEGPDRALGEDLFPGHLGAFPLQIAKCREQVKNGNDIDGTVSNWCQFAERLGVAVLKCRSTILTDCERKWS